MTNPKLGLSEKFAKGDIKKINDRFQSLWNGWKAKQVFKLVFLDHSR